MENFFYNDMFFSELHDLAEYECWEVADIELYSEDYVLDVNKSSLEPIMTLSAAGIVEILSDERFSENGMDREISKIMKILNDNIDFDSVNRKIPKLYYETTQIHSFSKAELLEVVNQL